MFYFIGIPTGRGRSWSSTAVPLYGAAFQLKSKKRMKEISLLFIVMDFSPIGAISQVSTNHTRSIWTSLLVLSFPG